jgi:YfiR/HmsC-like
MARDSFRCCSKRQVLRYRRIALQALSIFFLVVLTPVARSEDFPEYRLKAAFVYNFALFTEWPAEVGSTINLCVFGQDPFGKEIDALQGKAVNGRSIAVQRKDIGEPLKSCQIVFVTASAIEALPRMLESLHGIPALTVADSPRAARQGVALNMAVVQNKVSFEANLQAAHAAQLNISSKLLRLATEVIQ